MADLATAQALLDATNTAILDLITNGQEVRINGRTYRRADLDTLYKMRKQLEAEVDRFTTNSSGAIRARRFVPIG